MFYLYSLVTSQQCFVKTEKNALHKQGFRGIQTYLITSCFIFRKKKAAKKEETAKKTEKNATAAEEKASKNCQKTKKAKEETK